MKIVEYIHAYPPMHNAGAEWMMHHINRHLMAKGHDITVVSDNVNDGEYEGVKLIKRNFRTIENIIEQSDVIISYLDYTARAVEMHKKFRKPMVYISHNNYPSIIKWNINPFVVYNSYWMADDLNYKNRSTIVHPWCPVSHYAVESTREYITLINCYKPKGGRILIDLARMNPEFKFLGVLGAYGDQEREDLPNLTYIENQADIRDVYARTKILIMPSSYESFGRTALEAACSGIPVICTPTPGLIENLGEGGIYVPYGNLDGYSKWFCKLENANIREQFSRKLKGRAKKWEKAVVKEMELLESKIKNLSYDFTDE
jgi:glycosyltransferase involved in cell wall biosynthesis